MKNKLEEKASTTRASGGMQEYNLVVKADISLNEKLSALKKQFHFEYGEPNEIYSACDNQGYITIACFYACEEMEATFIRWIQRICSQFQSFPVTLNNYSGFPKHTIHLRVQELTHFNAFALQLEPVNAFITACNCQLRVVNPYLPVATELPEHVYAQAIVNYSQQTFHETFMANELILIKRENPIEEFKTVTVFNFLPAPEEQVA
jgi:hypothetical protein